MQITKLLLLRQLSDRWGRPLCPTEGKSARAIGNQLWWKPTHRSNWRYFSGFFFTLILFGGRRVTTKDLHLKDLTRFLVKFFPSSSTTFLTVLYTMSFLVFWSRLLFPQLVLFERCSFFSLSATDFRPHLHLNSFSSTPIHEHVASLWRV